MSSAPWQGGRAGPQHSQAEFPRAKPHTPLPHSWYQFSCLILLALTHSLPKCSNSSSFSQTFLITEQHPHKGTLLHSASCLKNIIPLQPRVKTHFTVIRN